MVTTKTFSLVRIPIVYQSGTGQWAHLSWIDPVALISASLFFPMSEFSLLESSSVWRSGKGLDEQSRRG